MSLSGPDLTTIGIALLGVGATTVCFSMAFLLRQLAAFQRILARVNADHAQLKAYACVDDVTEFYPRHYGMVQFRTALREHRLGGVVFVDLDDFGQINKKYGWLVGDGVLKNAADIIRSVCRRATDVCVRYGGDELLCFIEADSAAQFANQVEQLRRLLSEEFKALPDGHRPTATLGEAFVLTGPTTPNCWNSERLIATAQARAAGRKRLRTAYPR